MGETQSGSAPGEIDGHELEVLGDKTGVTRVRVADEDDAVKICSDAKRDESNGGMRYYWRVFGYATSWDTTLYAIAILASIALGAIGPLMTIVFGRFITKFNDFIAGQTPSNKFLQDVDQATAMLAGLFAAKFALAYLANLLISIAATHVTCALRADYLRKTLSQEIALFDREQQSVATHLTSSGDTINLGIGDKLSSLIQGLAMFFAAIVVALTVSWKLALITLSLIPAWFIIVGFAISKDTKIEAASQRALSQATNVAQDAFGLIKTVRAFGAEQKLLAKHNDFLDVANEAGRRKPLIYGILYSSQAFIVSCIFVLAFWQGYELYESGDIESSGPVFTVLLSVCMANGAIQQIGPQQQAVANASTAARALFQTIDRPSLLDPLSETGQRCMQQGQIEIRDLTFAYPQRPELPVLQNLTLSIPARKTTALVGPSGCGKSTLIALLERWYDIPSSGQAGSITLDGIPLSQYNTRYLRSNIGLVQQEPTLFSGTVFENIAMGMTGKQLNLPFQTQRELVQEACRQANAHEFIMDLPRGYDTNIGERGGMLSGGQRQRIAIARAVVSNPRILLLDEATSALDPSTERVVQGALERVMQGRTTIVIAHRLATVRNADKIVVLGEGKVVEQGRHGELMRRENGKYAGMVRAQDLNASSPEASRGDEDAERGGRRLSNEMFSLQDLLDYHQTGSRMSFDSDSKGSYDSDEKDDDVEEKEDIDDLERKDVQTYANWNRTSHDFPRRRPELSIPRVTSEGLKHSLLKCFWIMLLENRPSHWHHYLILSLGAAIGGAVNPIQAILFSKLNDAFVLPEEEGQRQATFSALVFLAMAFATAISYFCVGYTCHIIGQQLATKYRRELLDRYLRMDQEFYDLHHVANLTTKLNDVPAAIRELLSSSMVVISIVLVSLVASSILGIVWGWKLGLVLVFGGLPILIGAGYVKIWCENQYEERNGKHFANSAALAIESTAGIRTIASLTMEPQVMDQYNAAVRKDAKKSIQYFIFATAPYALSQSLEYLIIALGFWYGSRLVARREYTTQQFMVVFTAIIFAGQAAAAFFSFSSSLAKARSAVNYILWLRTVESQIRETSTNMGKGPFGNQADVRFDDVEFRYRKRPTVSVLKGMKFKIESGQYAAFVGPSGCGKSTVISLLQRFYDPLSGQIMLNGQGISAMSPHLYRKHISLVQQEPGLFQGSIRDNVTIGLDEEVSDDRVREALRMANCLDFVSSLPEGLETGCGGGGNQLSGGQRQRISIARALIRRPQLLLLDEATSALDTQSERIVQESLESARLGRTVVAVAHRLSTVRNANVIFVVGEGRIVECGSHEELLRARGLYYSMCQAQSVGLE
ncbi:hypothetical protein CKM354_001012100 [Cercospora kikuchii]|uniref:ABC transporter n=1 Tax=Cercospora kikuchii TaxID=84275 RepID=A0A9P3CWE4_9PEZI|nr:uncharacterized protein CKM354_001012100 [Cercospora kikuchii]GIZ47020.1 hypothetical protein CKM354_001012100 [Cercospora kikuchii]